MIRHLGYLILGVFMMATTSSALAHRDLWTNVLPNGQYQGKIESGASLLPSKTVLTIKAGKISGVYYMTEEARIVKGSLHQCRYEREVRELTCHWRDRYGRGLLVVNFSESLDEFSGIWYSSQMPEQPAGAWNGKKDAQQ